MKQKKFILQESEIPRQWYNIQADMVNKPLPPLNPSTREPLKAEDLSLTDEEAARRLSDGEKMMSALLFPSPFITAMRACG